MLPAPVLPEILLGDFSHERLEGSGIAGDDRVHVIVEHAGPRHVDRLERKPEAAVREARDTGENDRSFEAKREHRRTTRRFCQASEERNPGRGQSDRRLVDEKRDGASRPQRARNATNRHLVVNDVETDALDACSSGIDRPADWPCGERRRKREAREQQGMRRQAPSSRRAPTRASDHARGPAAPRRCSIRRPARRDRRSRHATGTGESPSPSPYARGAGMSGARSRPPRPVCTRGTPWRSDPRRHRGESSAEKSRVLRCGRPPRSRRARQARATRRRRRATRRTRRDGRR